MSDLGFSPPECSEAPRQSRRLALLVVGNVTVWNGWGVGAA